MQAKRRSYCVITTHMIPTMTRAGGYEAISELEAVVQSYIKARSYRQQDKLPSILLKMREICIKLTMMSDLGLEPDCSDEELES